MPNSKQIVYLSQAQYAELIANGNITVDGVTVTYDENDIYVTPQAEPVTDVRVAGTNVAANGVAEIPKATTSVFGVASILSDGGLVLNSEGRFYISPSSEAQIKTGTGTYKPLTAPRQHIAAFYGLAKAAGDTTQSQSANTVGNYTDTAKEKIQSMLGITQMLAHENPNLIATQNYAIGDVFTANGKLYKAISAIAANDSIVLQNEGETVSGANAVETNVGEGFVKFTDYATAGVPGIAKVWNTYGVNMNGTGNLCVFGASDAEAKVGAHNYRPITPNHQHQAVFYGLAKAAGADEKDSTLPVGEYTDTAKSAIRTMLGAVGTTDYATTNTYGIVKPGNGLLINSSNVLSIAAATAQQCKVRVGSTGYQPLSVFTEDASTFYGLAYAAGDTTMASSSNTVGTYTDNAKASIKSMLGIVDGSTGTVDVSGTTPTITAVENTRYVCGEVTTLDFTPAASGICIVRFTSGSTVTVLTLPSTIKFPEWFDPTSLETNTIYEICVTDGIYGAVMSWAL